MPYGSILHKPPTNLLLLATKQESHKKAFLFTKNTEKNLGKNSEERTSRQKKKIEKVTGQGRRTREEIAKWNQKTALRIQTGGIGHPRPPSGVQHRDPVHSGSSDSLSADKPKHLTQCDKVAAADRKCQLHDNSPYSSKTRAEGCHEEHKPSVFFFFSFLFSVSDLTNEHESYGETI